MTVVAGALLVILTWVTATGIIISLGLWLALLTAPKSWVIAFRQSLWWGLASAVLIVLITGLLVPLASLTAVGVLFISGGVAVLVAFVVRFRRRPARMLHLRIVNPGRIGWAYIAALALATGYLAVAALGPVTNYDSGLYHLGAIRYAADFTVVPGLANLYFPFGYNASLFPLAAILGSGPWDGEGYRLINGFILALVMVDLALRLLRRRRTIGTVILMIGVPVMLIPMVALSDYWVTSPTTDSTVFALTFVSVAYLSDALVSRRTLMRDGSIAVLVGVVLVSLRPLMAIFLIATVLSLALCAFWRRRRQQRGEGRWWVPGIALGLIALALGIVQTVRDYFLSGWIQYPLSIWSFNVPWRAADPVWNRTPTLGAARDPLNLWEAADGFGWIPAWLSRLPTQWEFWYLILLGIGAFMLWLPFRKSVWFRGKLLMLGLLPSAVTSLVWFLASPPAFRFAWGVLFSIPVIVAGSIISGDRRLRFRVRMTDRPIGAIAAGSAIACLTGVLVFSTIARLDVASMTQTRSWIAGPMSIEYRMTPITPAQVREQKLDSGLVVRIPVDSDQCWAIYPMCTAQIGDNVALRGSGIQSGFLP